MTDTEKIKELLRNYKKIKSSVEIELNSKYPEYSLDSISFVEISKQDNTINSIVENYVVNKYSLPKSLIEKIQVCEIIKAAYKSLTELEQMIVSERYFENKSYQKVGEKVRLHKDTVSKKINDDILPGLQRVGILKAWELFTRKGDEKN